MEKCFERRGNWGAGFIGSHVVRRLVETEREVIGIDNFEPYYDVALKHTRLASIKASPHGERLTFREADIADEHAIHKSLETAEVTGIVHLAA